MICENITIEDGRLHFAGQDTVALAEKYGTPVYLLDEDRIRKNCQTYTRAMSQHFPASMALYASKALECKGVYRIVNQEGLGIDVVSAGELAIAHAAGFPVERAFFHGGSKTDGEIAYAMDLGIGFFVADGFEELEALNRLAGERNIRQKILLRLTPGIDPHTYEAVATGKVDSKFGVPIGTGQAEEFVLRALEQEHLQLMGYHCHVGSQVFESAVFRDSADIMLHFAKKIRDAHGFYPEMLDLGGGYGVRYVESDPVMDIALEIQNVAEHLKARCLEYGIPLPFILMEPGRSIAADAGMTLYTIQAIKKIPGHKTYLCVDGGMTDNPRYALYGSDYTIYIAENPQHPADQFYSIGGRCCESGDLIQEHIQLPKAHRGEHIAVCTTGAYNHSMSSTYNAVCRPPVIGLYGGKNRVLVRRETFEDLLARECDE